MSTRTLAVGLALNRIAFGLTFVVAPRWAGRSWVGPRAAKAPQTQLFGRALGARDLALGFGALRALQQKDDAAARAWMAGQTIADGTDIAATLAARRSLPAPAAAFALAVAAGSTAIAAWSARSLGR